MSNALYRTPVRIVPTNCKRSIWVNYIIKTCFKLSRPGIRMAKIMIKKKNKNDRSLLALMVCTRANKINL